MQRRREVIPAASMPVCFDLQEKVILALPLG
jgi:hypothetical protein